MPNLRGKTWTETTPAEVTDANFWENHLYPDEDSEFVNQIRTEGGVGHNIINANGVTMPKEKNLKFLNAEVTDDATTQTTIVDAKGQKGDSATISIGTVTTGVAGSNATVTNVGTSSDAILNFTIPRGADGSSQGGTWGSITGNIEDQTDLQNQFDTVDSNISTVSGQVTTLSNTVTTLNNTINNIHSLPSGGQVGQVLTKASSTDFDAIWTDSTGGLGIKSFQANPTADTSIYFNGYSQIVNVGGIVDTSPAWLMLSNTSTYDGEVTVITSNGKATVHFSKQPTANETMYVWIGG